MPLGNSITYDENSLDGSNPRPDGNRISYRFKLYNLLNDEGHDFDFVGSEDCGINYFGDPELDDNAGFPGIETWQLSNLINTGYNAVKGQYETSGPYLNYHPADIILLHIGTNDLIESAYQVEDLLDKIRKYDSDVYILVAKIVNRRTFHPSTTTFNNNVAQMVFNRHDPNILMVNIETGAGINYSTDMIDNLHPNQAGYDKMGVKWFEAIMSLNQAPVISTITEQFTSRGNDFAPIALDDYVVDGDDPDHQLTWTFTRKLGSQLNVFIDGNRNLMVSPNGDWYGSEILTLKVEDTGSGAFPASQTKEVLFTVEKGNDAPVIESNPGTVTNQGENYSYTIQAYDTDGDSMTFSAIQKPSFLSFNGVTHQLSGIPSNDHVGFHNITLRVSDGKEYTDQSYQLEVLNVNDPPLFVSIPQLEVDQGTLYSYVIYVNDPDDDSLTYSAESIPDWLYFNEVTRVLSGTPDFFQVGVHDIILKANDGTADATQEYQLTVLSTNDPPEFISAAVTEVNEDGSYYYNVIATDNNGDALTYSAPTIPDWLTFDPANRTLQGQPENGDVGVHDVIIRVSDSFVETDQNFSLTVFNVNDAPSFTSEPLLEVHASESYIYRVEVADVDQEDQLTITAVTKPDWLTLASGTNDALLYGTPTTSHIGSHAIIIQVSDGIEEVMQGYTLKVNNPTAIEDIDMNADVDVYPNPADLIINFRMDKPGDMTLYIYNAVGILKKAVTSDFEEKLEVNISDLERGIYLYKAIIDGQTMTGRFIKK